MKQTVILTESQLNDLVTQCVNEAMQDEGLWNNLKTAGKTFMGKSGVGLGDRFSSAVKNFKNQGQADDLKELGRNLRTYMQQNGLDPKSTSVASVLHRLFGRSGNVQQQINHEMR